jgi:hypothetical protein
MQRKRVCLEARSGPPPCSARWARWTEAGLRRSTRKIAWREGRIVRTTDRAGVTRSHNIRKTAYHPGCLRHKTGRLKTLCPRCRHPTSANFRGGRRAHRSPLSPRSPNTPTPPRWPGGWNPTLWAPMGGTSACATLLSASGKRKGPTAVLGGIVIFDSRDSWAECCVAIRRLTNGHKGIGGVVL